MFSPTEIHNVAWFLVLLIGAWVIVNALIDISGGRSGRRQERVSDEHLDGKGD